MTDLVKIAEGMFSTPNTRSITTNPMDIKDTSGKPPLFGDPMMEIIGENLIELAQEAEHWAAVSAERLRTRGVPLASIDCMCSEGYLACIKIDGKLFVEPTQIFVDYYTNP